MRDSAGLYFQLVGLLLCGSALWVGIQTTDPTTELAMMAFGALFFWCGYGLRGGGGGRSPSG